MFNNRPTYPLETERLYLRPFRDEDLSDLFEYSSRPDVVCYLMWEVRDLEQTRASLAQKKDQTELAEDNSALTLAVVLKEDGRLIGEVILFLRSREFRQGEIGYVFNPAYHGQGYATEAVQAMMNLGFEHFNFHRIYGRCDPRNTGSWKLMERLAMRKEAHFIHNDIFKGEWGDELVYAILEKEWRAKYGSNPERHSG